MTDIMTIFFTLLLLLGFVFGQDDEPKGFFGTSGPVIDLPDAFNFKNKVLDDHGVTAIMFYAHWCPYSRQMRPMYYESAKGNKSPIKFYGMDCGQYYPLKQVCHRFNIVDYPDVRIFVPASIAAKVKESDLKLDDTWNSTKYVIKYGGIRTTLALNDVLRPIQNFLKTLPQQQKRDDEAEDEL